MLRTDGVVRWWLRSAVFDEVVELVVLVDRGNDDDVLEVFARHDQRDSSDVDLLDDGLFFGTRATVCSNGRGSDDHRVDFGISY